MLFVLIAKYLNVAVAIVLVARLLASRLLPKYRVFALFLLYDLGLSLLWVALPWRRLIDQYGLDYRTIWLATRPLAWLLYIWVVYAILHKVMDDHPGILRTSRRIFAASVVCANRVRSERTGPDSNRGIRHTRDDHRACVRYNLADTPGGHIGISALVPGPGLAQYRVPLRRTAGLLCGCDRHAPVARRLVYWLVAQFEYDRGFSSYRLPAALASLLGHARRSEEGNTGSYLAAPRPGTPGRSTRSHQRGADPIGPALDVKEF
jgi:hypothetical protein